MFYNSIFISDLHLGTSNSKADQLLKFLEENRCNNLFLIGDIIDMINLRKKMFWDEKTSLVIKKLIAMSRDTNVHYITGNHDYYLDMFFGQTICGIQIHDTFIYETLKKKNALILHGHQFDGAVQSMPFLYWLGNHAYDFSVFINRHYNRYRKLIGKEYWSLSMFLKSKVKNAVKFIGDYEKLVTERAAEDNCSIVICGHIHVANDTYINDIRYLNTGCWTEYCSAVVETITGELKLIKI